MKRVRKSSNRVSWATGFNLCQVKLFLSEECPSKVGQKAQDHLQAKTSSTMHSSTAEYNDLPPGFESNQFLNKSKYELLHIPRISWRCPLPFVFDHNWHIVAGEESKEKENQNLREFRVLEAVYPRLSAIPPSPSVSLEVEEEDYDDNLTFPVPMIPIEEEESMDNKHEYAAPAVDTLAPVQSQNLHQYASATTKHLQCKTSSVASPTCENPLPRISPGSKPDLNAAAAVVAAILKSNPQLSLIDMDLLLQIMNDPVMIDILINDHKMAGATTASASSDTTAAHTSGSKPVTPSASLFAGTPGEPAYGVTPTKGTVGLCSAASGMKPATPSISMSMPIPSKPAIPSVPLSTTPFPDMKNSVNRNVHNMSNRVLTSSETQPPQQAVASIPITSGGNLHPITTNQVRSTANTMPYQASTGSAHPVRDANYLKSLIRQHGYDKQDLQIDNRHSNFQNLKSSVHDNNKPGEVKPKIPKTCIFYNSSRGCRNGSSCPFQHERPVQWGGDGNSKRLKL